MKGVLHRKELNTTGTGNRYRFVNFSDRIANINVDVFHRISESRDAAPEHGAQSYFEGKITRWSDTNLTAHYSDFVREVRPLIKTLPQLLYHRKKIIEILIKHLKVPESMALEELLDLTSVLARDLREFYFESFPDVFQTLLELLDPSDPLLLEKIFQTIGFLFKFLTKQLLQDLETTLGFYKPMLFHSRDFVRNIAAESFAFLLRKSSIKQLNTNVEMVFTQCTPSRSTTEEGEEEEDTNVIDGLGNLMFYTIKGVKDQLHSNSEELLPALLRAFEPKKGRTVSILTFRYRSVRHTFDQIINHVRQVRFTPNIWKAFISEISRVIKAPSVDSSTATYVSRLVELVHDWASFKEGARVENRDALLELSKHIVVSSLWKKATTSSSSFSSSTFEAETSEEEAYDEMIENTLNLISVLLQGSNTQLTLKHGSSLCDPIFSVRRRSDLVLNFCRSILKAQNFAAIFLARVLKYSQELLAESHSGAQSQLQEDVVLFLMDVAEDKSWQRSTCRTATSALHADLIRLPSAVLENLELILSTYLKNLKEGNNVEEKHTQLVWATVKLLVASEPRSQDVGSTVSTLTRLDEALEDALGSAPEASSASSSSQLFLRAEILRAQSQLVKFQRNTPSASKGTPSKASSSSSVALLKKRLPSVIELVKRFPTSVPILDAANFFLGELSDQLDETERKRILSTETQLLLIPVLLPNLISPRGEARLRAVQLLDKFVSLMKKETNQVCNLFELCAAIETTPYIATEVRSFTHRILMIQSMVQSNLLPDEYVTATIYYLIGTFFIRLTQIWGATIEALGAIATSHFDVFWDIILKELNNFTGTMDGDAMQQSEDEKEQEEVGEQKEEEESDENEEGQEEDTSSALSTRFSEATEQLLDIKGSTDVGTVVSYLWKTLTSIATLIETKSDQIVPLFLDFIHGEYQASIPLEEDEEEEEERRRQSKKQLQSRKTLNDKLANFLQLFSKFTNPNSLYKAKELKDIFFHLTAKTEENIQKLALRCLCTWKEASLTLYVDRLEKLVDEKTFREELASFNPTVSAKLIAPEHRAGLIPILINVLRTKLINRRGRFKSSMAARRATVLAYFASLQAKELSHFVNPILKPFSYLPTLSAIPSEEEAKAFGSRAQREKVASLLNAIPPKKIRGFLNMFSDMMKQLGHLLELYLPKLISITMHILFNALYAKELEDVSKGASDLRALSLDRLAQLFDTYPSFNYSPWLNAFFDAIRPSIPRLPNESYEKVTPLFHLFATWGKHLSLAPLLHRESNIVPVIFSCFSRPNISVKVLQKLIEFVEDVIELEQESKEVAKESKGKLNPQTFLLPEHISVLIDHFGDLLKNTRQGKFKRFTSRELEILSHISSTHKPDPIQAKKLIDLLLPFLQSNKKLKEETRLSVVTNIGNFLSVVTNANDYIDVLSQQFELLPRRDMRQALCTLFEHYSKALPSLKKVVPLINDLNSYSTVFMDSYDFDRRLKAYALINEDLYKSLSRVQLLPILYNYLFFMRDHDMSIRNSATYGLVQFSKRVNESSSKGSGSAKAQLLPRTVLTKVILPAIKKNMTNPDVMVRKEFITAFASIVKSAPNVFPDLQHLTHSSEEEDFFELISSIQIHSREKAMKKFTTLSKKVEFKNNTLKHVLLPLFLINIMEAKERDTKFVEETVNAIGTICQQFEWSDYLTSLLNFLRSKIPRKSMVKLICGVLDNFHFNARNEEDENDDEVVKKGFLQPPEAKRKEKSSEETEDGDDLNPEEDGVGKKRKPGKQSGLKKKKQRREDDGNEEADDTEDETEDEDAASDVEEEEEEEEEEPEVDEQEKANELRKSKGEAATIQKALISLILPRLNGLLKMNTKDSLCATLALAIVKVMKLLPSRLMKIELPRLLLVICNELRHKEQDHRDEMRQTLQQVALALGPPYFLFILEQLESALARGFHLHVLGYTVHSLLKYLQSRQVVKNGEIDYCLPKLLKLLLEDVLGDTGEKKEVEKIAMQMKETASSKAYDGLELLGRMISFKLMPQLLSPVMEIMKTTQSHHNISKLEEILRRLNNGLNFNPTIEVPQLLIFIHQIVSQNLDKDIKKKDPKPTFEVQDKVVVREDLYLIPATWKEQKTKLKMKDCFEVNKHLLVEFGLNLLHSSLKKKRFNPEEPSHLQMLDPYVALLKTCLRSKYTLVLATTLKCLGLIFKLKLLPSISTYASSLTKEVFKIVKKLGSQQKELLNGCFKCLSVMITQTDAFQFTEEELKLLLTYIIADLEELANYNITFGMAKIILSRKLMAPEVYDMMKRISELAIQSQLENIRKNCSSLFLQFLLYYPMGEKRMQQHLSFLITNLAYPYVEGRQSVLELFNMLCNRFPKEILNENAELFFFPFVLRLVNDDNSDCKRMIATVLKKLMTAVDTSYAERLLGLAMTWYQPPEEEEETEDSDATVSTMNIGKKKLIQRAAIQVIGLFFEALPNLVIKLFNRLIPSILKHISPVNGSEDDEMDEEGEDDWQGIYFSLTTFEKIMQAPPTTNVRSILRSSFSSETLRIWERIARLMKHDHVWIRTATARLVGHYFAEVKESSNSGNLNMVPKDSWLGIKGTILELARGSCVQLQSQHLDENLAGQAIKNLIFIGNVMYRFPAIVGEVTEEDEEEEEDDQEESDDDIDETAPISSSSTSSLSTTSSSSSTKHKHAHWLFRRLSFMARKGVLEKRKAIFRWFAAMGMQLSPHELEPFLVPILSPIYRVMNSTDPREGSLKSLGEEVMALLKKRVGITVFFNVYNAVQNKTLEARLKRKRERKVQLVIDPELGAKRKMKKNVLKKQARKRKLDSYTQLRTINKTKVSKVANTNYSNNLD